MTRQGPDLSLQVRFVAGLSPWSFPSSLKDGVRVRSAAGNAILVYATKPNRELNRTAILGKALSTLQPIRMCRELYRAAILG